MRVLIFRTALIIMTMFYILKGFDGKEREVIDHISSLALIFFLIYMVLPNRRGNFLNVYVHPKVMDAWTGGVTGVLYPLTGVSGGIIFTNFFKKVWSQL